MNTYNNGITVWHGTALQEYAKSKLTGVEKERFLVRKLHQYMESLNDGKVCALYGLWKTGKKTMMLQEIVKLAAYDKCLLVRCEEGCSMMQLRKVIESYPNVQYIFIDEVTRLQNFIETAGVLADQYAAAGKKVVLTGTDSLGLYIASREELYDRMHFIHTTNISYAEQHTLLGTCNAEYILYGGTLSPDHPFYDVETTGAYVDIAIVNNIVHTLEKWNQGRNRGVLDGAFRRGDLPSSIYKVLECKQNPIPDDPGCAEAIRFWLYVLDVFRKKPDQTGASAYCFMQPGLQYRFARIETK